MHVVNGFEQDFRGTRLHQITVRAGLQRAEDALTVLIDREHDDLEGGQGALEVGHAFNARHAWQFDVHEHDVGLQDMNPIEGFFAGRARADSGEFCAPLVAAPPWKNGGLVRFFAPHRTGQRRRGAEFAVDPGFQRPQRP